MNKRILLTSLLIGAFFIIESFNISAEFSENSIEINQPDDFNCAYNCQINWTIISTVLPNISYIVLRNDTKIINKTTWSYGEEILVNISFTEEFGTANYTIIILSNDNEVYRDEVIVTYVLVLHYITNLAVIITSGIVAIVAGVVVLYRKRKDKFSSDN